MLSEKKKEQWHLWFAWYPVIVRHSLNLDDLVKIIWLKRIWRKKKTRQVIELGYLFSSNHLYMAKDKKFK